MEKAKAAVGASVEGVIPNPKKKLLNQVREVMRVEYYSIRTAQELLEQQIR